MKLAVAQMQVGPNTEENLSRGIEWIRIAAEKGASVICFPELSFLPFFPKERALRKYFSLAEAVPGPTTDRISEAAVAAEIVVIVNIYEKTGRGDFYSTALVMDADGTLKGRYRMAHIAEGPGFNEKFYYWPGDSGYPVFQTHIGAIGVAICHDRNFPEVFRCLALNGAEIVFVPTAFTLSAYQEAPKFLDIPQQAASMANSIFTVCVNRVGSCARAEPHPSGATEETFTACGASLVTNPFGEIVHRAALEHEELAFVDIELTEVRNARQRRPYFRDRRPETYAGLTAT
ncbi:MAG TPA: nitrilase-related carbon-nitrogen hydrolase [Chthoniobacterales bacterium]|nr:nitrilase-related carbon-nitrogen hydrolase [Chthoniobacterales bacterium]